MTSFYIQKKLLTADGGTPEAASLFSIDNPDWSRYPTESILVLEQILLLIFDLAGVGGPGRE